MAPIFCVCYIIWMLASVFYIGEAARWLFDVDSWWVSFIAFPLVFAVSAVPFGTLAVCGCLFYYLAFVENWNMLSALAFVFPGVAFMLLSVAGCGISTIFDKLRGR